MAKTSAGLLMYRSRNGEIEVLLVHPGGPFWTRKNAGAWFVPKGELEGDEEPLVAARREFQEETGVEVNGPFTPLGEVKHKSGKKVIAWAVEGNWDTSLLRSNTFVVEWPPKSGQQLEFPEIDKAEFFSLSEARKTIHEAESAFLDRVAEHLHVDTVPNTVTTSEQQGQLF